MKSLIEISVSITADSEEAIGDVFESVLQQRPSVYIDADTGRAKASVFLEKQLSPEMRTRLTSGLKSLRASFPQVGRVVTKIIPRENWAESWKKHFKPIEIGSALLVKPSWSKRRPRKYQAVVILDPGLSFGTGQHATTSFCLQQLTALRQSAAKQSFLDIGTGSGILAIAAAKLGYSPVEAFDFDPEAVRVARENALCNGVQERVKPLHKDLTKLPIKAARRFDVICANLIYDLLITDAVRITNRVKSKGHLILAGILSTQFPAVEEAYAKVGFKVVSTQQEKEWQSGLFRAAV